jgi:hypothetical protein
MLPLVKVLVRYVASLWGPPFISYSILCICIYIFGKTGLHKLELFIIYMPVFFHELVLSDSVVHFTINLGFTKCVLKKTTLLWFIDIPTKKNILEKCVITPCSFISFIIFCRFYLLNICYTIHPFLSTFSVLSKFRPPSSHLDYCDGFPTALPPSIIPASNPPL